MIVWEKFDSSRGVEEWNSILLRAQDYTVFQSFGWGEHKKSAGWHPERYIGYNKTKQVVGMVQMLMKKLPMGIATGWAAGGPVFQFKVDGRLQEMCDFSGLLAALDRDYPKAVFRFHSHIPYSAAHSFLFQEKFNRPLFRLNSGYTIFMDLDRLEELPAKMAHKHRYNKKQAEKIGLEWKVGCGDEDIKAMLIAHRGMVEKKNLFSILSTEDELKSLRTHLGETGMTIITGFYQGEPVTTFLTFDFGKKSIYMVGGTSEIGRKNSAAYPLVLRLLPILAEKGIRFFDFGGLDPVTPSAAGVNRFKLGYGGDIAEYVGEWEWSSSDLRRVGMNLLMKAKGIGR